MAPVPARILGGVLAVSILVGSVGAAAWRFVPLQLRDEAGLTEAPIRLSLAAYGDLARLDPPDSAPLARSIAPQAGAARLSPSGGLAAYGDLAAPPAPADPAALRAGPNTADPRATDPLSRDETTRPFALDRKDRPQLLALAPVPRADAPPDGFSPPEVVPLPPSAPPRPSLVLPVPLPPARPPELKAALPPGPPVRPDAPVKPEAQKPEATSKPDVATPEKPAPSAVLPPLAPSLDRPVEPPAPSGPFAKGQPAYVRIFKQEGQLELWLKRGGRYALYKSYAICKWSGKLGPKLKEGDYQSPEGFYNVTARQLNPNSQYHLSFNVGYPNAYDRQHGRTGSALMVHGDCVSVGCFAMTNKGIEEIYGFVEAALKNGQREVPVHIFPFRMTASAIARESGGGALASLFGGGGPSGWGDFWRNLKEGYDLFERTGEPPQAWACNKRYAFGAAGAGCARIAGW